MRIHSYAIFDYIGKIVHCAKHPLSHNENDIFYIYYLVEAQFLITPQKYQNILIKIMMMMMAWWCAITVAL